MSWPPPNNDYYRFPVPDDECIEWDHDEGETLLSVLIERKTVIGADRSVTHLYTVYMGGEDGSTRWSSAGDTFDLGYVIDAMFYARAKWIAPDAVIGVFWRGFGEVQDHWPE